MVFVILPMSDIRQRLRIWFQGFSPQTGINLLIICVILHILAFGQIALPFFSPATKKTLGLVIFSLAKAFQYTGLAILGVEGYKKLKSRIFGQEIGFKMPEKRRRRRTRHTTRLKGKTRRRRASLKKVTQ